MCHAHHVTHWINGGTTSPANLILLCGHHHRLIHSGPWRIEVLAPGVFQFVPPQNPRGGLSDRAPPDG